ncbi:hypothetical protein D1609_05595 [Leptospira borgpetersenii serovar Hardjo-bovis]|nr:hypothetical protein B9T54_05695 [Leptospira borgpetersenii serovar Hardjo-bovis]AYR10032.1 hypothetical protein D1609_05595 [Leptospira borgpetersenii serovar Hardjo-bovis]TQE51167.1 hypothetical protein FFZ95_15400 [Leptospira borgpetersenii]TQE56147.1 hypothetical protein FFZ96_10735 [Leptospira borgpetersenii]
MPTRRPTTRNRIELEYTEILKWCVADWSGERDSALVFAFFISQIRIRNSENSAEARHSFLY